ncbi:ADP-ribosylglycohydrolase family protein [Burkholderia pseudomallei]|uniref:ADP-ribosylglycohydrolase family protein n=1 Tax=Burkholderia pseudomallei TaxID=28450 RepID=UPI0005378648|nr:ADP-ribosylglycohydrolase family protein [Burkholderia pseudomallei]KGW60845.1 ADP-ribosylglycohydrolase family protein [Burkholderia pseudomallei MSHR1029]
MVNREDTVVASALWAAYGDAVGFPTELVTLAEFRKRTGQHEMTGTIAWARKVGGLFGANAQFPRGAYSDDTQLRLCTSRAIRGDGFFDVESFAKIELPVWLNYALGAGRGSKFAAGNLGLRDSTWSQNFYRGPKSNYWDGGGNGAAMRVQPHVWAARNFDASTFMPSVIRDAVCTHGHPRALAGAAIHALMLAYTIDTGVLPAPTQWADFAEACDMAFASLTEDDELALVWCPNWERLAGRSLAAAFVDVKLEWQSSCERAVALCDDARDEYKAYRDVLEALGGFLPAERGSGLKTPLYAAVLAWLFRDHSPEVGLLAAANTFGSDTDTIATMAGALIGVVTGGEPQDEIQDSDYIRSEAKRLAHIGQGKREVSFSYPDTLSWVAPRAQRDAWILVEDGFALSGLGPVVPFGDTFVPEKQGELEWQWCRTSFDQTILAKRKPTAQRSPGRGRAESSAETNERPAPRQMTLVEDSEDKLGSIHELTNRCIREGFDPKLIGECLLALSNGPDGVEKAIAFSAIIAKARLARNR